MIRTVIVDDEPVARSYLRSLVEGEADFEVVDECRNGQEAVESLRKHRPDLVFLDVQMPGMDGFEVLREHGVDALPAVIFVTAFDHYALSAFDVHALDYLLKPFDEERFQRTVTRAREHVGARSRGDLSQRLERLIASVQGGAATRYLERLAVKKRDETLLVRVDDIDWFQSESNYVVLHVGDRTHLVRSSLTGLENELDPSCFARIHRTVIVNVDRIQRIVRLGHGDYRVFLHNGRELNVSRRYKDRLGRLIKAID